MSDAPILLTDEVMQSFIREGFITIQSTFPKSYHDAMYRRLEPLEEEGPVGHNNLLPMVPELSEMLEEPVVQGALLSILGPDYHLHFHRHDHVNWPEAMRSIEPWHIEDGRLHKDGDNHSHVAVDGRRHHATRYVMLFYYAQDTPIEMGPAAVAPRSQYLPRRALERSRADLRKRTDAFRKALEAEMQCSISSNLKAKACYESELVSFRYAHAEHFAEFDALDSPWQKSKIPLTGEAGTVVIMNFDIAHGRFGLNTTGIPRHMVKFVFARNQDPTVPSWDNESPDWMSSQDPQEPIWHYVWKWHLGNAIHTDDESLHEASELANRLRGLNDAEAIGAGYTLGSIGAVEPLLEAFTSADVDVRCVAGYGFTPLGAAAVDPLLGLLVDADAELRVRIADLLGDIGPRAVGALPDLIRLLEDDDPHVRQHAVSAIGIVAQAGSTAPTELVDALRDDNALVRQEAALAVARLGKRGCSLPGMVSALEQNLYHDHHHVRGWSIEALKRLDTPDALETALKYLTATRWDHSPTSGDPWSYE
jgi:hypothetical protein